MRDFHQLKVWVKAHELALGIYRATTEFPAAELYGLTNQLRRASVSIASNIAEGCGRESDADFKRFLQMASGSASEIECQLLLARDLGFLPVSEFDGLTTTVIEVKKMLYAFRQNLS